MKTLSAIIALVVLLTAGTVVAQNTGKITGKIQDVNYEALPGANVYLVGTKMGAAADAEGKYMIANVPPGIYKIVAQMIGFEKVIMEDVTVKANKTTELDFRLSLKDSTVDLCQMSLVSICRDSSYQNSTTYITRMTKNGVEDRTCHQCSPCWSCEHFLPPGVLEHLS